MPPRGSSSVDVFVSYGRPDILVARRVTDALRRAGLAAWLDCDGIRAGARARSAIAEVIGSGPVLVVVWSPITITRSWVWSEVQSAARRGSPLIGVLVGDVGIPANMPPAHWFRVGAPESIDDIVLRPVVRRAQLEVTRVRARVRQSA